MARQRESSFCPLVSSRTVRSTRRSSDASRVEGSGDTFPSAWKHGSHARRAFRFHRSQSSSTRPYNKGRREGIPMH